MSDTQTDIRIPGHRILRQLGRGGMASVYLALQESMEREVALKVMLPSLAATDPSFSERFVREAKIIAKLSHPHINAVFDVGVAGVYNYFTMEYITGGDLKSRIRQGMAPKAALAIVRQVASALAFAHSKGYVHRDVKPENVLFRDSGTAVLTDFGIAKASDGVTQMTATGAIIGTPHYMSPEQAMGRPIDKRSDIYSLGVMAFEMFTGRVPYTGDSAISIGIKHLKDPLPQLPGPLNVYQPLLDKFLAKEPAERFQSGEEVMAAIDALAARADTLSVSATVVNDAVAAERTVVLGPSATTAQTIATGTGTSKRGRGLLMTAIVLVAAIAGAAYFVLHKPFEPVTVATVPAEPPAVEEPQQPAPSLEETEAAARAREIASLLAQADKAAQTGRLLGPSEKAAVPSYQRVLELESDNPRATRALNEIAGRLISQAEHAIEKKDLDRAEELLKQAEEADSGHPMLFSRRLALNEMREKQERAAAAAARARRERETAAKTVAPPRSAPPAETPRPAVASIEDVRAREQREREQKLQGLLSRFQELVAASSLSATRTGLAQDLMNEATRVAPDDSRVRALPERLADAYLTLATTKAEQKQYKEADTLIRRGLELRPNHRQLLALQKDIEEKQKPKRQTFGTF